MIYGVVTPARIAKVVSSLNFIWPLERLHEEVMGLEEPQAQGDMGTSFSNDVRSLFGWFRQQFTVNMHSMTQTSQFNPITASRFTNVHHPTAMVLRALKDDWKDWVDNRLSMRKCAYELYLSKQPTLRWWGQMRFFWLARPPPSRCL